LIRVRTSGTGSKPRKSASAPTIRLLASAALIASAANVWGGGASFGDPDEHSPDEGPRYYGFVKDERGAPVRDARVTATYRTLSLATRSNATGAYRLRGFKDDINAAEVTITCAKDGYTVLRVFRRTTIPKGKPVKAVETECRLKRAS
jgi:hypothetical protein